MSNIALLGAGPWRNANHKDCNTTRALWPTRNNPTCTNLGNVVSLGDEFGNATLIVDKKWLLYEAAQESALWS